MSLNKTVMAVRRVSSNIKDLHYSRWWVICVRECSGVNYSLVALEGDELRT